MFKRMFVVFFIIGLQGAFATGKVQKSGKEIVNSKNAGRSVSAKNSHTKNELTVDEEKFPLKLHNLIDLALERNNNTKQAYLSVKMAEDKLVIAESYLYPKLDAGAGVYYSDSNSKPEKNSSEESSSRNQSASASLSLSYNLFAFGKYRANVKSVQHYLNRMKYQESDVIQEIIYKVIENYYGLLSLEAQKEASIEAENLSLEAYKAASLKYKLGLVPLVDKLRSNNSYSDSRLNRIRVENDIKKQKAALNSVLNLEPNYTLYLEVPDMYVKKADKDIDYFISEALLNRMDLKMLREERSEKIEELNALNATKYPEVTLQGSVSGTRSGIGMKVDNTDKVDSSVSLNVKIPLFDGFNAGATIRTKEKELKYLNIRIKQLENDISNEVWTVYHDLDTHQRSFFIAKNSLETASENARVTLGMYKNGKASILDVLDSQSQLGKSKSEFINSRYNWLIYRMKMLRVIGKMDLNNIINLDKL
jgi:outer membrane protein